MKEIKLIFLQFKENLCGQRRKWHVYTSLEDWLVANKATVKYLPDEIDFKLENFDEFLEKRKKLMVNELVKILGATEDDEASEAETV